MGLDQYAYSAVKSGQRDDYYENAEWDPQLREYISNKVIKPSQIAYWRKHPNLHGWMEKLWLRKQGIPTNTNDQDIEGKFPPCDFNGVELELTWQDLDELEKALKQGKVADLNTKGFFFGDASDDYYRQKDLDFVAAARAELFLKLRVFYNSSW